MPKSRKNSKEFLIISSVVQRNKPKNVLTFYRKPVDIDNVMLGQISVKLHMLLKGFYCKDTPKLTKETVTGDMV